MKSNIDSFVNSLNAIKYPSNEKFNGQSMVKRVSIAMIDTIDRSNHWFSSARFDLGSLPPRLTEPNLKRDILGRTVLYSITI